MFQILSDKLRALSPDYFMKKYCGKQKFNPPIVWGQMDGVSDDDSESLRNMINDGEVEEEVEEGAENEKVSPMHIIHIFLANHSYSFLRDMDIYLKLYSLPFQKPKIESNSSEDLASAAHDVRTPQQVRNHLSAYYFWQKITTLPSL